MKLRAEGGALDESFNQLKLRAEGVGSGESFNRMKLRAEGAVLDETPGEVVCRILRRVSGFAIADSFACRSRGNIPREPEKAKRPRNTSHLVA